MQDDEATYAGDCQAIEAEEPVSLRQSLKPTFAWNLHEIERALAFGVKP